MKRFLLPVALAVALLVQPAAAAPRKHAHVSPRAHGHVSPRAHGRVRTRGHARPARRHVAVVNSLPGPAFPHFDTVAQMNAACTSGLDGARERVKALEKRAPGLPWLKDWDALYGWQEDHSNALIFLQNVHPDSAFRQAADACELRWQDFSSTLGLDQAIYDGARNTLPLLTDPIDRRTVQVALESFEDAGMALPVSQRARAKQIQDQLTQLSQQFNKNIRDQQTQVAFTEAELKGVPASVWKDRPRSADGKIELGTDYPSYFPVMQYADDPAARERMYRAKLSEGGPENLKLLAQVEQLRLEYAKLFGYPSYADFVLRRRMAGTMARVTQFLDEVQGAVAERELHDITELRDAKAKDLGTPPESTHLERWDLQYYTEKLMRQRFAIDDDAFRQYFPPQQSLQFVMRVAEKMFNIRYDRVPGQYWAPDVQAYSVTDLATKRKIASLYVDLYPREGKYNHAAVWPLRNAASGTGRTAEAALVVNFDRKGLTLRELETLLHEFGHSVHDTLSQARYASVAGTNVQLDFVEAPSQMLEDWVYDKNVMKVFHQVCPTCKPVPDDMLEKAREAKDFPKGILFARQLLYARYDLALHGPDAPDPMATWTRMESATPLGTVPGTMFPSGFAHLVSGYGAGYYGYLWSLVVAMDMRTAFAADRLDPKVGARYRQMVIGQGGQKLPQQLVKDFLGRDMSTKAFFDYLKQ